MFETGEIGWQLLIAIGAGAGFFAGLLGIGGGFVVVPCLLLALPMLGVTGPDLAKVAIATSLVLIIPTSIASTQAHAARGSVDWAMWALIAPAIVAGGLIASMTLSAIPVSLLVLLFAGFSLLSAARLLRRQDQAVQPSQGLTASRLVPLTAKAVGGGALSTLLGVGVAFFAVPMLSRFIPLPRAIGTASALALPMAIGGAAGYLYAPQPQGCAACTGFVHLPAVAVLGVATVLAAPLGAQLTAVLPVLLLRRVFAAVLVLGALGTLQKKLPEIAAELGVGLGRPLFAAAYGAPEAATAPHWLAGR
jgi:uncharacterized membrane protein YfcA